MADNEREFKIKITTSATGDGAQKTAAELDNLSPKTRKYIESLKEGRGAAEGMEVSHKSLYLGMRMLGPEFQEVGHLGLEAFANPLTAGFLAVAVAAGKVLSDYQKMRDAIESAVDVSGIQKVVDALGRDGMIKALIEGGVAADEFWAKINRLADAQQTLKEKTDDAVAATKAEADANDKTLSALENAALAELDLAKARGDITAAQYRQQKSETEDRFEGQRENAKALEQKRVIELRQGERATAQATVAAGPDTVTPKQLAAEQAAGELAKQTAALAEWQKKLEEINKWFTEKGALADRATYTEQDKARRLALGEIAGLQSGGIPTAQKQAKATADELAAAQAKVAEAQKRKSELDREIATLEAEQKRDANTRAATAGANQRTRAADSATAALESPEGQWVRRAADLETASASGHATRQQLVELQAMKNQLARAGDAQGAAMLAGLNGLHDGVAHHTQMLLAAVKRIQALEKQIKSQAAPP